MKCKLSIQEKLKDLRIERNLRLEELAEATGLSRSALGSYETNEDKDISHTAVITLAEYYEVSCDYLLGFNENRKHRDSEIADLHLDDATVEILRSEKLNNRLLCEMIKCHAANYSSYLLQFYRKLNSYIYFYIYFSVQCMTARFFRC